MWQSLKGDRIEPRPVQVYVLESVDIIDMLVYRLGRLPTQDEVVEVAEHIRTDDGLSQIVADYVDDVVGGLAELMNKEEDQE